MVDDEPGAGGAVVWRARTVEVYIKPRVVFGVGRSNQETGRGWLMLVIRSEPM